MNNDEIFNITLSVRNFEIDLFWKRSNYFLVLNTAIAVGFFSLKSPEYEIHLSCLGLLVCILWFCVNLGSKFWQDRWEYQLNIVEKELNMIFQLFTANRAELNQIVRRSFENNSHKWYRKPFNYLILKRPSVSFMMILLSLVFIFFWFATLILIIINKIDFNMTLIAFQSSEIEPQNLYWLFSSAAQSISAFIALLLTGFTFVLTIISNIEQKDESLSEILHRLKVIYYRNIILLSFITGLAIVGSLYSVYINPLNIKFKTTIQIVASILDLIAIFAGILFVLFIINPNRHKNIANKLYKEEEEKIKPTGQIVDKIEFIQTFIEIEKLLREILERNRLYDERRYRQQEYYSVRTILDILLNNKMIDYQFYSSLLEINSIRNLVMHGRRDTVDKKVLTLSIEAKERLKKLIDKET